MIQQFYSKLTDKEKKVFYFAAGAVILALFDALFLGPVTSKLKNIDQEIIDKENNLKRDLRLLSYQTRILAEREAFSPYYNSEVMTPDQVKASFLQKIEMLATGAKINLTKVAPSGEEKQKGFVKYFADLECTGVLEDIVKFMHAVDSTKDLLKIVKVNIVSKQSAKEVSATMTVVKIIFDPRAVWTEKELAQRAEPGAPSGSGQAGAQSGGQAGSGSNTSTGGTRERSSTGGGGPGASGSGGTGGGGGGGEGAGGDAGEGGAGAGAGGGGAGGGTAGGRKGAAGGAGGPQAAGSDVGEDISVGRDLSRKQTNQPDAAAGNVPENIINSQSKAPSGGGRAKVSGIMDLWHNFWGMEAPEEKNPGESVKDVNWEEVQEDQNRKTLWEKLMTQSKPEEKSE